MAEIRIDAAKAERIISQILRDEGGLHSAKANAVAEDICRRLSTSMPMPTNQPLQSYKIIPPAPPSDFAGALATKTQDSGRIDASGLWAMVYDRGRDLPATLVDPPLR